MVVQKYPLLMSMHLAEAVFRQTAPCPARTAPTMPADSFETLRTGLERARNQRRAALSRARHVLGSLLSRGQ